MRKILFVIGFLLFFSCHDNYEEITLDYENVNEDLLSRSITPITSPVFEWWDTTSLALPGLSIPVTLPWYNGASTQIPSYMLTDYKPEDGWEMVYNYCISTPPGEENKSYLVFYNKLTGILRVFYYNNNDVIPADATFWRLEITQPTSLFNSSGPISLLMGERLNNPAIYVSNLTTVPSKSVARGWNCFDVELAYDDQLASKGAKFNMKVCQKAHLLFFMHKAPTFTSWGFVIT